MSIHLFIAASNLLDKTLKSKNRSIVAYKDRPGKMLVLQTELSGSSLPAEFLQIGDQLNKFDKKYNSSHLQVHLKT